MSLYNDVTNGITQSAASHAKSLEESAELR